jgi:hypothetical protein
MITTTTVPRHRDQGEGTQKALGPVVSHEIPDVPASSPREAQPASLILQFWYNRRLLGPVLPDLQLYN